MAAIQPFMQFMRLLDKKLFEFEDSETLDLVRELQQVTAVDPAQYAELQIRHYLHQCLYPNGGSMKSVEISIQRINQVDNFDTFLLRKKVGPLGDGLKQLLRGYTDDRRDSLENYSGTAVYMFLNRMVVPAKKKNPGRYGR